jgi:hypothetical protein
MRYQFVEMSLFKNSFLNLNGLLKWQSAISHQQSANYLQQFLFRLLKTITKTGIITKLVIIHHGADSPPVSALKSLKCTAVVVKENDPEGIV